MQLSFSIYPLVSPRWTNPAIVNVNLTVTGISCKPLLPSASVVASLFQFVKS